MKTNLELIKDLLQKYTVNSVIHKEKHEALAQDLIKLLPSSINIHIDKLIENFSTITTDNIDLKKEVTKLILDAVSSVNYVTDSTPKIIPLSLKDKNNKELFHECIIHGALPNETQEHYWNLGLNADGDEFEMIACTYGYVHAVQQKHLTNMTLIGSLKKFKHLLECD